MLSEYASKLLANYEDALLVQQKAQDELATAKILVGSILVAAQAEVIAEQPKIAQSKVDQLAKGQLQGDGAYANAVNRQEAAQVMVNEARIEVEVRLQALKTYRAEQYAQLGL